MQEDRPSLTAQRVAARRAAHQVLENPRVFDDPLALAIVGRDAVERMTARHTEDGTEDEMGVERSRYLRAFLVARSRYAEDQLAQAVGQGTRQYVILGAGLDTFAYRNPYPQLQVFEVDHPATQRWKQHRLEAAGISIPVSLTFAPVDFERQTLSDGLMRAGLDRGQPVFFSWLGVTPYLRTETVFETLREIASLASENAVVFDYAVPRSSMNLLNRMAFDALASRVAAAGEPFQGFFEPREIVSALKQHGFSRVEDLDGEAINLRYFRDRADGFRVAGGSAHLVCAADSPS